MCNAETLAVQRWTVRRRVNYERCPDTFVSPLPLPPTPYPGYSLADHHQHRFNIYRSAMCRILVVYSVNVLLKSLQFYHLMLKFRGPSFFLHAHLRTYRPTSTATAA